MPHDNNAGYVLYLGCCVFDHDTMLRRPGVNPAGTRWQTAVVRALQRRGERVRALAHAPEPAWPQGRIRDAGTDPLAAGIEGDTVAYWNLPGLRLASLRSGYLRGFRAVRERHGDPGLILSFNAYPYNAAVGRRAQELHGIPWVCIVADVPESPRARRRHDRWVESAAGRVFVSWSEYARPDRARPKLHLDGGIGRLRIQEESGTTGRPPVVLYTGSLGHWGGVDFLLDSFRRVRRKDVELWICGHGQNPRVRQAASEDPRIRFLGLVSEARLEEISRRASVFVNPRPSTIAINAANFPSKVLEYLSYGKPVVSTWTAGLAPHYRDVLTVPEHETEEGMAAALEDVLSWGPERRRELAARVESFLKAEKLWDSQADRLVEWLDDSVRGECPR